MAGTEFARIGTVISEPGLKVDGLGGERIIDEGLVALKAAWQKTLASEFSPVIPDLTRNDVSKAPRGNGREKI